MMEPSQATISKPSAMHRRTPMKTPQEAVGLVERAEDLANNSKFTPHHENPQKPTQIGGDPPPNGCPLSSTDHPPRENPYTHPQTPDSAPPPASSSTTSNTAVRLFE